MNLAIKFLNINNTVRSRIYIIKTIEIMIKMVQIEDPPLLQAKDI